MTLLYMLLGVVNQRDNATLSCCRRVESRRAQEQRDHARQGRNGSAQAEAAGQDGGRDGRGQLIPWRIGEALFCQLPDDKCPPGRADRIALRFACGLSVGALIDLPDPKALLRPTERARRGSVPAAQQADGNVLP